MMKPEYIIVHCSDSPQGRGDTAIDIHRWHKARGWDGIGYSAVILEDGTLEYGRPDYWDGSHARGYNHNSLGVCLIGTDEFTEAQYDTLATYIHNKLQEHNIKPERVLGHNMVSNKTCPNFDVDEFCYDYNIKGRE